MACREVHLWVKLGPEPSGAERSRAEPYLRALCPVEGGDGGGGGGSRGALRCGGMLPVAHCPSRDAPGMPTFSPHS